MSGKSGLYRRFVLGLGVGMLVLPQLLRLDNYALSVAVLVYEIVAIPLMCGLFYLAFLRRD